MKLQEGNELVGIERVRLKDLVELMTSSLEICP